MRAAHRLRALMAGAVLVVGVTASGVPSGVAAADPGATGCEAGTGEWPASAGAMRGATFLGHLLPDPDGILRFQVDRVFEGQVPAQVVLAPGCHGTMDLVGEALITTSTPIPAATGALPADLRLWLTDDTSVVWRVGDTGRLGLEGLGYRPPPPTWLLRPRFVSEAVGLVMGTDAPGAETYETAATADLPPLLAPTPTGMPWTVADTPPGSLDVWNVTRWRGGFVAFGSFGNGPVVVRTSTDGTHWVDVPGALDGVHADAFSLRPIAYRGGITVVTTDEDLHLAVWRSENGVAWRRLADRPLFAQRALAGQTDAGGWNLWIQPLSAARGRLRIVGRWGYDDCPHGCPTWSRVWTSDDGLRWHGTRSWAGSPEASMGSDAQVVGTSDGFLGLRSAPAASGPGCWTPVRFWASKGGVRWHPVPDARPFCAWRDTLVVDPVTGARYVIGTDAHGRAALRRSADGRTWINLPLPAPAPGSSGIQSLAVHGSTLVANELHNLDFDDERAEVLVSLDSGATWTRSADWPALMDGLTTIAVGHAAVVAGAASPTSIAVLELPGPRPGSRR
ncbi:MAG: hypothetical protein U0869_19880 [Chloroflexota bacterium]